MSMATIILMLSGLGVVVGLMLLVWLASLVQRDASLVDRFWGLGFVILAWFWWALGPQYLSALLPVVLVTIWGLRLSLYLTWRNWGAGEDIRYARMREKHGDGFGRVSLVTVFLLQAVVLWIVALPLFAIGQGMFNPDVMQWVGIAGIGLWVIGFFFETIGDWQMARFRADPANQGRVMDRGLWRYTRHPNYFGDLCVCWSIYLFSIAFGGWWTVIGPLLMSFLLVRVSGVRLLERDLVDRKPGYADYVRRTNALLPWFPRPNREGGEGSDTA